MLNKIGNLRNLLRRLKLAENFCFLVSKQIAEKTTSRVSKCMNREAVFVDEPELYCALKLSLGSIELINSIVCRVQLVGRGCHGGCHHARGCHRGCGGCHRGCRGCHRGCGGCGGWGWGGCIGIGIACGGGGFWCWRNGVRVWCYY